MKGKQATEYTKQKYYNTGFQYLNEYNNRIIDPQMQVKDYLTQNRCSYYYGVFLTITVTRNIKNRILFNNLGQLIRYTNKLLFPKSVRKTGKGIKGIGSVEKQINGNTHFHILLEHRKEYGDTLQRLKDKFIIKSKKFEGLFDFDNGLDLQIILEPEKAQEYIIKETDLRTLDNIFFVHPEGVIGLLDDGCYRLNN